MVPTRVLATRPAPSIMCIRCCGQLMARHRACISKTTGISVRETRKLHSWHFVRVSICFIYYYLHYCLMELWKSLFYLAPWSDKVLYSGDFCRGLTFTNVGSDTLDTHLHTHMCHVILNQNSYKMDCMHFFIQNTRNIIEPSISDVINISIPSYVWRGLG